MATGQFPARQNTPVYDGVYAPLPVVTQQTAVSSPLCATGTAESQVNVESLYSNVDRPGLAPTCATGVSGPFALANAAAYSSPSTVPDSVDNYARSRTIARQPSPDPQGRSLVIRNAAWRQQLLQQGLSSLTGQMERYATTPRRIQRRYMFARCKWVPRQ